MRLPEAAANIQVAKAHWRGPISRVGAMALRPRREARFTVHERHTMDEAAGSGMPDIRTIWHEDGRVFIVDQTLLPLKLKVVEVATPEQMWEAIRALRVRGAPAIGIAAGPRFPIGIAEAVLADATAGEANEQRVEERHRCVLGGSPERSSCATAEPKAQRRGCPQDIGGRGAFCHKMRLPPAAESR